jgi:hypothetical protein
MSVRSSAPLPPPRDRIRQLIPVPATYDQCVLCVWLDGDTGDWSAWTEPVVALALVEDATGSARYADQMIEPVFWDFDGYQTLSAAQAATRGSNSTFRLVRLSDVSWELLGECAAAVELSLAWGAQVAARAREDREEDGVTRDRR